MITRLPGKSGYDGMKTLDNTANLCGPENTCVVYLMVRQQSLCMSVYLDHEYRVAQGFSNHQKQVWPRKGDVIEAVQGTSVLTQPSCYWVELAPLSTCIGLQSLLNTNTMHVDCHQNRL